MTEGEEVRGYARTRRMAALIHWGHCKLPQGGEVTLLHSVRLCFLILLFISFLCCVWDTHVCSTETHACYGRALSLSAFPVPCTCVYVHVWLPKRKYLLCLWLNQWSRGKKKQKFPDLHEMCSAPASYLKFLWICLCPKGCHGALDLALRVHFYVPPGENHLCLARCQRDKLLAMARCRAADLLAEVHAVEEYLGTEA